jgi:hypothetical protein
VGSRIKDMQLPSEPKARAAQRKAFRAGLDSDKQIAALHEEVRAFCTKFPVSGTK